LVFLTALIAMTIVLTEIINARSAGRSISPDSHDTAAGSVMDKPLCPAGDADF